MPEPRVAVFIDGANFYNRLRQCGWPTRVDVGAFAERLAGNRRLIGVWYYNVSPPVDRPVEQIARLRFLAALGRDRPKANAVQIFKSKGIVFRTV